MEQVIASKVNDTIANIAEQILTDRIASYKNPKRSKLGMIATRYVREALGEQYIRVIYEEGPQKGKTATSSKKTADKIFTNNVPISKCRKFRVVYQEGHDMYIKILELKQGRWVETYKGLKKDTIGPSTKTQEEIIAGSKQQIQNLSNLLFIDPLIRQQYPDYKQYQLDQFLSAHQDLIIRNGILTFKDELTKTSAELTNAGVKSLADRVGVKLTNN